MPVSPHSPRRQRRAVYNADTFERRLRMTVPLSRELRSRFHVRSVPLRKGDTVRVMKGSFIGREERVAKMDRRSYTVTLDNVTLKTGEEKLKPLPVRTNHLLIIRLNLADAWRRKSLQVREEEVTPEERGETPDVAEGEAPAPTVAAPPAPAATESKESEATSSEAAAKPPPKRARKPKPTAGAAPKEDAE
ncbi:MAG: 50S ribosomal protein L24 [Thermoplasmata archaeon]